MMQLSAFAAGSVTLAWNPSTDTIVAGYNIYYGGASGTYTNEICVGNATNATISGLIQGTTYYFAATTYASSGAESLLSSEVSYLVPPDAPIANQPPTLNAIGNLTTNENAGLQIVFLSGISSGAANENNQTLTVTATSGNKGLIPKPTVNYTSANTSGTLTFTPAANAFGTATVTVVVHDNGGTANGGVDSVTNTFTVTVNAVNQKPTLNAIGNLTTNVNAGLQTVSLSGITSGAANENQVLQVTAVSSNLTLIPNPTVNYTSPNTSGTLTFTPVANANGTALIAVTVNDGGTSNNVVTQTFTVTVNAVNQKPTLNAIGNLTTNENAGLQTVSLSGITSGAANENNQTLTVTATSGNKGLIPKPTVNYTSANTSGTLTFTPAANAFGTATVTVVVHDNGGTANGGVDSVTNTFTVTVNAVNQKPTLNAIGNLTTNVNAGLQTVSLSGITSGAANENQVLQVTAVSSNLTLIPNPTVNYTSPNTSGTLTFTPVANANGTALIAVTVNDGGTSNNVVTQTFTVTVNAVNQTPTLDPISDLTTNENAGLQTVSLSGITSGAANENQTLLVTAFSSNTNLVPTPTVNYTNGSTTGKLTFTSVTNATGTSVISVTVNDGGATNNSITRTFKVTLNVNAVSANSTNQSPTLNPISNVVVNAGAPVQRIALTGISSGTTNKNLRLRVTATSSNQRLVYRPMVSYINPRTNGSLTFRPGSSTGTATISVTVNNGANSNNIITRTFTVTIVPRGASTNLVASISRTTGTRSAPIVTGVPTNSNGAGGLAVAAALAPAAHVSGQFALTVVGTSGHQYVVEASADWVHWIPVQTNTAPFTFVDTDAGKFQQRFYRTVSLPPKPAE